MDVPPPENGAIGYAPWPFGLVNSTHYTNPWLPLVARNTHCYSSVNLLAHPHHCVPPFAREVSEVVAGSTHWLGC